MEGEMTVQAQLIGTLSPIEMITGELSPVGSIEGELTIPKIIEPETYRGTHEVTPSGEAQILMTAEKVVKENIVINPIPSNYGLITWNGSKLTVS